MGVGERRPIGRDQEVARKGEFEHTRDRRPIDRTDNRRTDIGRNRKPRTRTAKRACCDIAKIKSRTECRVGTSNHDRGDIRGGIERRDRFTQPTDQQCVQGIADSEPVEPHGRYLTIHINVQDIIHGPRSTIPA